MNQVVASVISNRKILPGFERPHARTILNSRIIWLHCPEIAREAKPGQFVMVRCGEECLLPRPFSIHQIDGDNIAIFYAVWADGRGTNWLSHLRKGNSVEMPIPKPLGNGFSISSTSHNFLLVAGGIGLAPLAFLAQQALSQGQQVTLLYGTANKYRYPELPSGVELVDVTEDGSVGKKGRVTDLLPYFVDWADQIFACGPLPMYKTMAQMPALKNKPVQVSLEIMMACGRGLCYGCSIKTKQGMKKVCADGPVFNLDDILWDEPGLC